ncbi:DUF1501 domain-containing protein [Paraconexibacter sp.]|uniref:DUF1501 domain-containing protein n=1 Tax=Paraconexibacter sp. TaxID=2949640 RepID=UPI003561E82D
MAGRLTSCDDFRHADARSRRSALATPLTRREVLGLGLGASVALYLAPGTPVQRALEAAQADAATGTGDRILVSVFLPGGLDLLDSIVPLSQYGAYRDARGVMARPQSSPRLGSTGLGIHDALTKGNRGGIKGLFDQGKIGLLPGIDYANPNLSHFDSRSFWETGLVTKELATGWLGRVVDHSGSKDNPFQALSVSSQITPVLRTAGAPVAAVETARAGRLSAPLDPEALAFTLETYAALGAAGSRRPGRDAVNRGARLTKRVADELVPYEASAPEPSQKPGAVEQILASDAPGDAAPAYPKSSFGDRMRTLAFMLAQPFGTRVAGVSTSGGFDTHDGQAAALDRLLADVSQSLAAFQLDIEQRGLGDRVMVLVWSEFGRRVKSNASLGTDHGAGGIAWVMGNQARPGVLTEYPSLTDLDRLRNLKVTIDFRQVYASLLDQWLQVDAGAIIPRAGELQRIGLVR